MNTIILYTNWCTIYKQSSFINFLISEKSIDNLYPSCFLKHINNIVINLVSSKTNDIVSFDYFGTNTDEYIWRSSNERRWYINIIREEAYGVPEKKHMEKFYNYKFGLDS